MMYTLNLYSEYAGGLYKECSFSNEKTESMCRFAMIHNMYSTTIKHYRSYSKSDFLLFRGRHNLHKGLQVTKGTRHILVYWTKS